MRSLSSRLALMLLTLAWCSVAFCGEIHDAADHGDLEKVKALIHDHPDLVFSKDANGWTPLHFAVLRRHQNVAEFLLDNNADVNARDNKGDAPLHFAALARSKSLTQLLLDNKAEVNPRAKNGCTPLHLAIKNGSKDVADLLRQHGGRE